MRRNTEAALLLDKEMTIQEELTEYLQFVLEIEEARIPDIIGTFNDYASKVAME